MSKKTRYVAFLVRWQDEGEQTRWKATIENAYTGEKVHFTQKNDLLRFLWHSLYGDETSGPVQADAEGETLKNQPNRKD
jgi:hypothetical protein